MKAAWVIRALVAGVVISIVVYIARNTYWEEVMVPSPLRGDAVTNPFYAVQRFAHELGATTERRQTVGVLDETIDVLVLANWHWQLIEDRRRQIETWVEGGGRLVVDNTLMQDDSFESWSGVSWSYLVPEDESEKQEASGDVHVETDTDRPVGGPEDFEVCAVIAEVGTDGEIREPAGRFSVCTVRRYGLLETERPIAWGLADDELQVVRVNIGEGSVTVLNLSPFGNRDLTEVDHGKLFVAASQLRSGTRIAFLSESEHASLFALMWMYGAPVVVLVPLVIAALLWRSSVRFGPLASATDTARRSLADQIRGTGRFAIRLGDGKALHAAAVRSLQEAASRRIAGYGALSGGERVAAIARKASLDERALEAALNPTSPRRAHELAHTIALLETARRNVLG